MFEINANAKINLFLEITGRRSDGYHTVDTVMQEVSVSDQIAVKLLSAREGIVIKTNIDSIPTDERNIAYKSAKRFFERIGADCGAEIVLTKNIPHEAGMGGGSTDAAAVLKALNELCSSPLNISDLHEIGSAIGADVPFFLYGGTAHMRGIGTDFVSSISSPQLDLVIAKPTAGVSTPAAYKFLDELHMGFETSKPIASERIIGALLSGNVKEISESMFNRFEVAADEICPQTKFLRAFMQNHSYGAMLSGSGAAVFAVAESQRQALLLKDLISCEFPDYFVCVANTINNLK